MSNYYTHYCVALRADAEEIEWFEEIWGLIHAEEEGAITEQERVRLEELMGPIDDLDVLLDIGELSVEGSMLYICDSAGSGSIDTLGEILHAYVKRFCPDKHVYAYWSCSCSKSRPDEFSGGALIATDKRWVSMNSHEIVQHLLL